MKGFSIIVCSYNGSTRIRKVIECLQFLKIHEFGFEIIIVDNNSSDDTYAISVKLAKENPNLKISVLKELRLGKASALITGFNKASYKYLVICDDDNLLSINYLTIAYRILEENESIGVLGGRGIMHRDYNLPKWYSMLENCWAVGKQANISGEIITDLPAVWGAGTIFRREGWIRLLDKGFKEFVTGRKGKSLLMAGEDTELCILFKALGYKIYYEDSMIYRHDLTANRLTWENLINLWEGFSRSQVYFNMYSYIFNKGADYKNNNKKIWRKEFSQNLHNFFAGASSLNFYRALYIAFIENREGYVYGLEKRKYLIRMRELWRIRNRYNTYLKAIAALKFLHKAVGQHH